MRIYFLTKTSLGKWSIGLLLSLIGFFVLFMILVASGQRGGETFFSNLALAIPMIFAGISGVSAFFTGIVGIIKNKDMSVLVFISTIIGLFVLFFVLGELLFPH